MELGIYHEFPVLPRRSQAECFAAGFDIVDASEEYGLDVMWLAELHFDKRRALAASPLVLGTAIAARTEPNVHSYALLPIGYPMGRFGPVRRVALADVVYEDRWGKPYRDL